MIYKIRKSNRPSVAITQKTHLRLQRIAKKDKVSLAKLAERVMIAGMKALSL